jgi:hypothetical protein
MKRKAPQEEQEPEKTKKPKTTKPQKTKKDWSKSPEDEKRQRAVLGELEGLLRISDLCAIVGEYTQEPVVIKARAWYGTFEFEQVKRNLSGTEAEKELEEWNVESSREGLPEGAALEATFHVWNDNIQQEMNTAVLAIYDGDMMHESMNFGYMFDLLCKTTTRVRHKFRHEFFATLPCSCYTCYLNHEVQDVYYDDWKEKIEASK